MRSTACLLPRYHHRPQDPMAFLLKVLSTVSRKILPLLPTPPMNKSGDQKTPQPQLWQHSTLKMALMSFLNVRVRRVPSKCAFSWVVFVLLLGVFSVPSTIHSPKHTYLQQTATTGGRVMLIGMGTRVALLPLSTAALREVDILGSFRYADTYPEALSLLSSPSSKLRTMVGKLVTHRFGLSDTKKAFEMLAKGVDEKGGVVMKIMVGPGA